MFLKSETIIIIGQLIFILILSLIFSTTALSPLNNNGLEGFSTSKLNYTDISAPTVAKDDLFELTSHSDTNAECKRVGGFSSHGVFCTPSSKPENIDIFSQAKGDISCESAGYFNSKGPLCLDENMKRMLATRGANAVGGNGQIGSA